MPKGGRALSGRPRCSPRQVLRQQSEADCSVLGPSPPPSQEPGLRSSGQKALLALLHRAPKATTHSHGGVRFRRRAGSACLRNDRESPLPGQRKPPQAVSAATTSTDQQCLKNPGGESQRLRWPPGDGKFTFFSQFQHVLLYIHSDMFTYLLSRLSAD